MNREIDIKFKLIDDKYKLEFIDLWERVLVVYIRYVQYIIIFHVKTRLYREFHH